MSALRTSAVVETAWAKALYEALMRYEPAPIFDDVCRELGNPIGLHGIAIRAGGGAS